MWQSMESETGIQYVDGAGVSVGPGSLVKEGPGGTGADQ